MSNPGESEPVAPESAWKRIPAGYKIVGAALAVVLLAAAASILSEHSSINSERAAIRRAGMPVTLRELNDYYPTPAGENAANVYLDAFAAFASPTVGMSRLPIVDTGKLPPRGDPLPEEMKSAIAAYLAANAKALDLLHKAAAIEACRYPVDFSQGFAVLLPHLAQVRQAARLLELEALMKAEEGKPDAAASAVADSFSAARSIRNEPLLITQLVRFATDAISLSALDRVLSRTALNDSQLEELSKAIASEDSPEGLHRGMAGERCLGEDIFRRYGPGYDPFGGGVGAAYYLYKASGMSARDHAEYLRLMGRIVNAAGGTQKEMRELAPELDKEILQVPKFYLLTRGLVPALTRANEEQLKLLARLRAARAALAVERFRLETGRLPGSLDDLVPKFLDVVPTDPFNDQPIQYVKLVKGFVTWSVGPDLSDNGGLERDPKGSTNAGWDVTFIIAR